MKRIASSTLAAVSLLCITACFPYFFEGEDERQPRGEPVGIGAMEQTGVPLIDQLIDAASACGYQSFNTVPAGWKMVLVGEQGCAVWAPSDWLTYGEGTGITTVEEGSAGLTGYVSMVGASAELTCTLQGVTDWAVSGLTQECSGEQRLHYVERVDTIAGVQIPVADVFFTCDKGGTPLIAYLWVSLQGTSPLCNVAVLGLWLPQGEMEQKTCTATQILMSNKCPSGSSGWCDEGECRDDCARRGYASGGCTSDDRCECSG